ncbi:NYN domain-containing protein [Helicobacter jaachi]|uniref:NYN domain-containing protein n=1 Tax=Helicobacter jaachi TaxID=1677920 RepID=UPI000513E86A|nr:NYN domain-containing protein [Helicobacter jaachi]
MRVLTYVDGFNLYHSIKDLGDDFSYLKWQNLFKLSKTFLSKNDEIISLKFFTAYPTWKPHSHKRHLAFVEILKDLGIDVIEGSFKTKEVFCTHCKHTFIKHEEKQTDVNIAVHIVNDIYRNKAEIIQLISGDTDLIPPLNVAKNNAFKIHLVVPRKRKVNGFDSIIDKKSKIKIEHLKNSFLGDFYTTKTGKIIKCPYPIPQN